MEFQERYGLYREMAEEYLRGLFTGGQPYGRLQPGKARRGSDQAECFRL